MYTGKTSEKGGRMTAPVSDLQYGEDERRADPAISPERTPEKKDYPRR